MSQVEIEVTLSDGRRYAPLRISNRALVDFDFTRHANGWPKGKDAPFLWLTFLAWKQLGYNGESDIVDTFKDFRETQCADIEGGETGDGPEADPTTAQSTPDSALL